jgi:hypothetical protein
MIYLRTRLGGFCVLLFLLLSFSCNKENAVTPENHFVNNAKTDLVKDWTRLSVDLASKCNGFNDLIASRAIYYMAVTMYESLLPGFENYTTLQAKINGFNITLPQPFANKQYNWFIVTNQALALVCTDMFKSSGSNNLSAINALRDKYVAAASSELDESIIKDSKELGNEIGWKIIEYSAADGRSDYYLRGNTDVTMPAKEGGWIPTPPDYTDKILLPHWGESTPALYENISEVHPEHILEYSVSNQSIMFAEATEVYNLTSNLNSEQMDLIKYWNENQDPKATPLSHTLLLFTQLLDDSNTTLDEGVEMLLRLSIAHYDGYILAWKTKMEYNILRPSTYIKQNISRYFIPEFSSTPIPEFISEKALIYNASAEILANYFGHRSAFVDFTQSTRKDLTERKRNFASFNEMAKNAAYSDLYSALHFRTSINAGLEMGYDLAQKTLTLPLKL